MTPDDAIIHNLQVIDVIVLYQACRDYIIETDRLLIPRLNEMMQEYQMRHSNSITDGRLQDILSARKIKEIFSEKINHHFIRLYQLITELLEQQIQKMDVIDDNGSIASVLIEKDSTDHIIIYYNGEWYMPLELPVDVSLAILHDMAMTAIEYLKG